MKHTTELAGVWLPAEAGLAEGGVLAGRGAFVSTGAARCFGLVTTSTSSSESSSTLAWPLAFTAAEPLAGALPVALPVARLAIGSDESESEPSMASDASSPDDDSAPCEWVILFSKQ